MTVAVGPAAAGSESEHQSVLLLDAEPALLLLGREVVEPHVGALALELKSNELQASATVLAA